MMLSRWFKSHAPQITSAAMLEGLRREAIDAQAHHRYRHAIALWSEVASHTLGDPLPHHRIGELYVRLGVRHEAVRHLAMAAQEYAVCDEGAKAHALRRLVDELSPGFIWDGTMLDTGLPAELLPNGPALPRR